MDADAGAAATVGGIAATPWAGTEARADAFGAGLRAWAAGANTVGGIWAELALVTGGRAGIPDEGADEGPGEEVVSTSGSDA